MYIISDRANKFNAIQRRKENIFCGSVLSGSGGKVCVGGANTLST